jgi:hypothetical protein
MDYNIDENRPVFMKKDKIDSDRFCQFIKNRSTLFKIFKILENFEKKQKSEKWSDKLKKTER